MRAKFYKGPWHNKVSWVRDDETYIVVAESPKFTAMVDDIGPMTPTFKKHIYTRSRHTHPNGSVFFVYEGKS